MAEFMPNARSIYSRLWSEATPAPLEAEPSPGEPPRLERRRLEFPTASLARLGEQFWEHDVAAAGAAVRDADGDLITSAPLRQAPAEIVALRDGPDDPPFDLLTPLGCLSGAQSAQAMLRDYRTRARISASPDYLYVALDWDDALWCDAAGLATVYCPGAEGLTAPLRRALAADLAALDDPRSETACVAAATPASEVVTSGESDPIGERPEVVAVANSADDWPPDASGPDAAVLRAADGASAETDGDESETYQGEDPPSLAAAALTPALAIVAWSPGAWSEEEPAGLAGRLLELAKAEQALGEDFPETIVWSPARDEIDRLQLIERYCDAARLRLAVAESVESEGRVLSALAFAPPPQNFIAARAALRRAIHSGDDRQMSALEAHYDHYLQLELVEPLLALGAESADPFERARCHSAAVVCEQLHHAALAAARLSKSPSGAGLIDGARYLLGLAKLQAQLTKSPRIR